MSGKLLLSGFTFVEVLLVVSIIGLISGLGISAIPYQIDKAQDARRKEDLTKFRVAFENYFNEKGCYPTADQWNSAACDSTDSFLSPSIPLFYCDPVTHEKYTYQATNADGTECSGSCGTCAGYRLLTRLATRGDPDIQRVGCDPDGCGIVTIPGKCPNWGIAMASSIPAPGFVPGQEEHSCRSSTPTTTPTPTTSPSPTPKPTPVACPNHTLLNGSFETDLNGDRFPDSWTSKGAWSVSGMQPGEGVVCDNNGTDGKCSYVALGWLNGKAGGTLAEATQCIAAANKNGSYRLSLDARTSPVDVGLAGIPSGVVTPILTFTYTDGSQDQARVSMGGLTDTWSHWTYQIKPVKDIQNISVSVYGIPPDTRTYWVDNVKLEETDFSLQPNSNTFCPGQLLVNGSFEEPSAGDNRVPLGWTLSNTWKPMVDGEGRICTTASTGSCSYVEPYGAADNKFITQIVPVSGKKGDKFTFSADAILANAIKSSINGAGSVSMFFRPPNFGPSQPFISFNFDNWQTLHWKRQSVTLEAPRDYTSIFVETSTVAFNDKVAIDSLCLQRSAP